MTDTINDQRLTIINLLVPESRNIYRIAKISFKKRRDQGKISYERLVYESVNDESLSKARYISKFDGENVSGTNGLVSDS